MKFYSYHQDFSEPKQEFAATIGTKGSKAVGEHAVKQSDKRNTIECL